jgi:hypothetical protein
MPGVAAALALMAEQCGQRTTRPKDSDEEVELAALPARQRSVSMIDSASGTASERARHSTSAEVLLGPHGGQRQLGEDETSAVAARMA